MNIMRSIASIALLSLALAAPYVQAGDDECVIDAMQWGGMVADPFSALYHPDFGRKVGYFNTGNDAGYNGPAWAIFELPQFKDPVLFGRLRVDVAQVGSDSSAPNLAAILYDINDIPLLLQPVWAWEDYLTSKDDMRSGRVYGDFSFEVSTPYGTRVEIPLSYDAMFDVNEAAGEMFAVSLTEPWSDMWGGEGDGIHFVQPADGGVIQLVIPHCKVK